MTKDEFLECGYHLDNFQPDQLDEIFDWEEVEKLDNNIFTQQRVFLLSQYLIGNVSEPFEEIAQMDNAGKWRVFDTWFDLVKDSDTLKGMGKSITREFIKEKFN